MDQLIKIIEAVSCQTGITENEIISKRRTRNIVYARHLVFYACRKTTCLSWKTIASFFNQHHSTAICAFQTISSFIGIYPEVRKDVESILYLVRQHS